MMNRMIEQKLMASALLVGVLPFATQAFAEEIQGVEPSPSAELAKKLANPVASLISVPLQSNFDFGAGPAGDGFQYKLNIQPVIPISLSDDWNVISRTILPIISQSNVVGTSSQSGLGDTVQSFFLSPREPTPGGWIWGVGPVILLPTSTNELLGAEKWGAGPTVVALRQDSGWTYGVLANHLWSFAGDSSRGDVNATFVQPFFSFTTQHSTTFALQTETTYDWENNQWTVPINAVISQVVKIAKAPVQLSLGGRYYAEKPADGPDWGMRFIITLLFPT